MSEPLVSIISTAIRTQYWLEMYKNVAETNTIPYEFVFVGNVKPTFPLPPNFFYIYSEAKPQQCLEIACRNAKGKYVMTVQDDLVLSSGIVNNLYAYMIRMPSDNALVMARFSDDLNVMAKDGLQFFIIDNPFSPIIGITTLIKREFWLGLGGFDQRFNQIYADNDLHLRMYQHGSFPFIVPTCFSQERPHDAYPRLVVKDHPDRLFLNSLWITPQGVMSKTRLSPVLPYHPNDIPITR